MTSIAADILISGGLLVSGSSITKMDVAVTGEKIIDVSPHPSNIEAKRTIDATGLYVLPGLIDAHNHPINLDKMDFFHPKCGFWRNHHCNSIYAKYEKSRDRRHYL